MRRLSFGLAFHRDLPGMESDPRPQTERPVNGDRVLPEPDRLGRSLEGGEQAIAGGVDLGAIPLVEECP